MNIFQKAKKNQKGFTLVELMVVVVIIGILVAIAIPVYNNTLGSAKEKADAANIRTIEGAVAVYIAEKGVEPELTIDVLVEEGYLREEPKSPYDATKGYIITFDEEGKYKVTREGEGSGEGNEEEGSGEGN
jgi:prepilin-type N-terminal cleavage/methylation domain-containing protein